jgi:hypothetical protein
MATRESPPVGINHPTVVPESLTDPSAEDGVGEDDDETGTEPSAGE